MSIAAGQLNRRITIQRRVDERNSYNEPIPYWTDVATVWAHIRDVSGREFFAAQATQNVVQTKILIRYRDGITPDLRIIRGEDIYNIEAVLVYENGAALMLMCSKGVKDG